MPLQEARKFNVCQGEFGMSEELIGIIGGTGIADALEQKLKESDSLEVQTPFGKPSGPIMVGRFGERKIAFLNRHGKGHKLSPGEVPFAANIFALKKLGVRTIIGSGAVGSLREEIRPADVVLVDQFIDKTFSRQNSFFNGYAAVHCEMSEPVCPRVREILANAAKSIDVTAHAKGTYICMQGPQFSTRAESHMHRAWGADVVGMTAMPEAKLARESQICYALIALPSDYDCWRPHKGGEDEKNLLQEIIGNLRTAAQSCLKLIEAVLGGSSKLINNECQCRKSLELAVWTDQSQIKPKDKKRLQVLFD